MNVCQKCGCLDSEEKVSGEDSLLCSDCTFYMKLLNYYLSFQKMGLLEEGKDGEEPPLKTPGRLSKVHGPVTLNLGYWIIPKG